MSTRLPIDPAMAEQVHSQGWALIDGVLGADEVTRARDALLDAARRSEELGYPTRLEALDPGGRNIRVYDLVAHHPVFLDLAAHPLVLPHVAAVLDGDVVLSNFTANIALPGSGSMNPHCDQSTIMPEPWPEVFAVNAVWCLDDVDEDNGATRFLPGSHHFTRFADVPASPRDAMVPFEAAAGSVIVMHGRLWHTSGENRSADRERAMLFAFYTRSFLRLQTNWWQSIPAEVQQRLRGPERELLGLASGNMVHGAYLAERGAAHADRPS